MLVCQALLWGSTPVCAWEREHGCFHRHTPTASHATAGRCHYTSPFSLSLASLVNPTEEGESLKRIEKSNKNCCLVNKRHPTNLRSNIEILTKCSKCARITLLLQCKAAKYDLNVISRLTKLKVNGPHTHNQKTSSRTNSHSETSWHEHIYNLLILRVPKKAKTSKP